MNVLLSSVGRRNYLVEFFRQALSGRGKVFGADADPYACALQECDKAFVVRRVEEPGYVDEMLTLCQDYDVRLMIPLIDPELPVLAEHLERFVALGTIPLVSPPAVVQWCFDKWATAKFLADSGVQHPQTYLDIADALEAVRRGELHFPLVVKPRWGSGSLGIEFPDDVEELEMTVRLLKKRLFKRGLRTMTDSAHSVVIQERLDGYEYGMDVVNDLRGQYITTFVRRKVRMRAGETDQAETVTSNELAGVGQILGQRLRHVGCLDCDVFVGRKGARVLELNPRFGGGYPFSHLAGANLPALLVAWACSAPVDPTWMTVAPNVLASKCDRLITHTAHRASQKSHCCPE